MANRRPQPLRITDGATYTHEVSVYDEVDGNHTAWDFTDTVVSAELRLAKYPAPLLATFLVGNHGDQPPQLSLDLSPAETTGLYDLVNFAYPVTERGTRPGDTPAEARMDIRLDAADGHVDYLFSANVLIYKVVTRP